MLFRRRKNVDARLIVPLVKRAIAPTNPGPVSELSDADIPITEPLLPDLWLFFAFDRPFGYELVMKRHLPGLGITSSDLRDLAVRNFRRRIPGINRHGDGPAYMLTAGGNLESSLLLLPDLWDAQSDRVPGELVVGVPARDVVVFTGSDSPEGLRDVRDAVLRLWASDATHLLSRGLFAWRKHAWEPFEPHAA